LGQVGQDRSIFLVSLWLQFDHAKLIKNRLLYSVVFSFFPSRSSFSLSL